MMSPERHLHLAPSPVTVLEAQGRAYISSGGVSIEVPLDDIQRIVSELLVSLEKLADAL